MCSGVLFIHNLHKYLVTVSCLLETNLPEDSLAPHLLDMSELCVCVRVRACGDGWFNLCALITGCTGVQPVITSPSPSLVRPTQVR